MGFLHPVARVDRLTPDANPGLEEWSPIRPRFGKDGGQNPAYRTSGALFQTALEIVDSRQ